ncbi:MAG: hypothetical protein U5R31_16690 [Acidimicrobiia bacterium]|nr:hypothetical protein [Acidimicrobiia bacterium]
MVAALLPVMPSASALPGPGSLPDPDIKLDVVWVVDESGSMGEEIASAQASIVDVFTSFLMLASTPNLVWLRSTAAKRSRRT